MKPSRHDSPAALPAARLDQVLGYLLARASTRVDRIFQRVVGEPMKLRPVEYTILALVLENDGISPAGLAQALAVTAPNITAWLARLEGRGLIRRSTSTKDRRAQLLSLTDAGRQMSIDSSRLLIEAEQATLAQFSRGEFLLLQELLLKLGSERGG